MDGKPERITCQIRYTLNPSEWEAFTAYAQLWVGLVERYGGTHLGYYIPCDAPSGTQISFPCVGQSGPRTGVDARGRDSAPKTTGHGGLAFVFERNPL